MPPLPPLQAVRRSCSVATCGALVWLAISVPNFAEDVPEKTPTAAEPGLSEELVPSAEGAANSPDDELRIPADWLQDVRDRSKGISVGETDAYFNILNRARDLSDSPEARRAAGEFVQQRRGEVPAFGKLPESEFPIFVDIFQHPELYRGRLVTLRGYLRRLISYAAPENDYGIATLHEAWLYTPDSQGNPAVVVCTEIPAGIPRGDQLVDHVSVTGYYFKHYIYSAQDSGRVAPMILAGQLHWNPAADSRTGGVPAAFLIAALLVFVTVLGGVVWMNHRTEKRLRRERLAQGEPVLPGFFAENGGVPKSNSETRGGIEAPEGPPIGGDDSGNDEGKPKSP